MKASKALKRCQEKKAGLSLIRSSIKYQVKAIERGEKVYQTSILYEGLILPDNDINSLIEDGYTVLYLGTVGENKFQFRYEISWGNCRTLSTKARFAMYNRSANENL